MVNVPELLLDQSASRNDAKIISKYHTRILELLKKTDENTQNLFLNLHEVLVKFNSIKFQPV
jgi:hypothetical protein